MKYEKPDLNIEKIELSDLASSALSWLDDAQTKDTAVTSFFVASV